MDKVTASSGSVFDDLNVKFEPCVIQFDQGPDQRTEIVLKDCFTVWEPWGTEGLQVGRDKDGSLVAVQFPRVI